MRRNDIDFVIIKEMIHNDYVGLKFSSKKENGKVKLEIEVSQQEINLWIENSESDPRFLDNMTIIKNRFPDRNPLTE